MSNRFYVDKTTGTFSDELLASGYIRLLEQLLHQQGKTQVEIVQTDFGHYYEIQTTPTLDLEQVVKKTRPFVLAPILRTVKNRKSLPILPDNRFYVVDYETEKEKRSAFFAAYSHLEGTLKRAYAIGDDDIFPFDTMPAAPHEHWNVFTLLNAPPMPINGYNKLMVQWLDTGNEGKAGPVCRLLCDLFSETPNDLAAAIINMWKPLAKHYQWTEKVTASQFFNPSQGKGINKPLPNGVGLGNIKDFWLMEWLKAVGFYHIAFTGRVKGADDRKTYVPAVGRADLTVLRQVQVQFKKKMRFGDTAVRSDIFTIIRYVKAFIERVETAQRETASETEKALLALMGNVKRPSDFMRGFHTVFYKSLGTSAATMNISFLNLPGWVEIQQPEDIAIFQDILEEHENIMRQLAENKGEEIDLLQLYRDFIVADNLDPFFEFTTAYSSWIISQGEKKGGFPPRRLDIGNLRRLIMSNEPQLSPILESEGFRNIAYAIRQSTVTAQYRKKQGDRRYDVRYGLGRDLVRQSQYPSAFIAALSDFLHKYNAENAQVMENRPGPYRRSIQTSDIEEIARLIDEHGSDVLAKLLVAFGYARVPRQTNEEKKEIEE
jgi:hypothetical protein